MSNEEVRAKATTRVRERAGPARGAGLPDTPAAGPSLTAILAWVGLTEEQAEADFRRHGPLSRRRAAAVVDPLAAPDDDSEDDLPCDAAPAPPDAGLTGGVRRWARP